MLTPASSATASAASHGGRCGSGHSVVHSLDLVEATVFLTCDTGKGTHRVATVRTVPATGRG